LGYLLNGFSGSIDCQIRLKSLLRTGEKTEEQTSANFDMVAYTDCTIIEAVPIC